MAQVLRGLPQPNILIVGQADSYVMQASSTPIPSCYPLPACHCKAQIKRKNGRAGVRQG